MTNSIYKFIFESSGIRTRPDAVRKPVADPEQHQLRGHRELGEGRSTCFRFGGEYTHVNLDKNFPQVFNGELVFHATRRTAHTDFQNFLLGAPEFSFGGGGFSNHEYRSNNFAVFAQDDWKIRHNLTLNLGLRTEVFGAFHDDVCHIGNLDPALANAGNFPFIYPSCVNKLNLAGLTGDAQRHNVQQQLRDRNSVRALAWRTTCSAITPRRFAPAIGIYYVREDVGTADQLSFQTPFLAGGIRRRHHPDASARTFRRRLLPGCPNPNPNALPQAGTLDPNFVPCLNVFQGFPGGDTTQAANYGTATGAGLPGSAPDARHIWPGRAATLRRSEHATVEPDGAASARQAMGAGSRLRRHARRASARNARCAAVAERDAGESGRGRRRIDHREHLRPMPIARSRAQGINGYNGFQLFANDAYSHYNSLQSTMSRRWNAGYFQAAYTFSRSTDATSSGNTAFNTAFNDESR